ncbi:MAG: HAD-IIB family hydrolase [Thermodesulfobacteriota bacterium]|nr:HAD-IIB family hydrolase [Thermodesulfobacteriota bacterium]
MKNKKLIIFSDLDGTLLDHNTYSFDAAKEALNRIKERDIPLVLCSSKTRAEIEVWRTRLDNKAPFISENGGAVFIPDIQILKERDSTNKDGYNVIELGIRYEELIKKFKDLKDTFGNKIRGFFEMEVDELTDLTGLSKEDAILAKKREYSEPFLFKGTNEDYNSLEKTTKRMNLNLTRGGRFVCLVGDNDKGKAVNIISEIYKEKHPELKTIAIGDSYNDISMLQSVDIPVLVKKPKGGYESIDDLSSILFASQIGPNGWNEAILKILQHLAF